VWGRRALFGEKCVLKGVAFRKTTREESQKTERKKSALYFFKHTLPTARGAKKLDVKSILGWRRNVLSRAPLGATV
jgi:hypothetical protein